MGLKEMATQEMLDRARVDIASYIHSDNIEHYFKYFIGSKYDMTIEEWKTDVEAFILTELG